MAKPDYDTSLARMAGNIAAGLVGVWQLQLRDCLPQVEEAVASQSVRLARAIVAEIKRTEPQEPK